MSATIVVLADTRTQVADYVGSLFFVYSLLIIAYVLASMVLSLGGRVPYNRGTTAVLGFLRDVCEPYLRIFRSVLPMLGPLDISPIVALIVLRIAGALIVRLIGG